MLRVRQRLRVPAHRTRTATREELGALRGSFCFATQLMASLAKQIAEVMTKGYFSEWCERQHFSSTRGQVTSDSMIGLEWGGDSLSDSQSNFASASQSDEGSPASADIFAAPDAELTSRNSYIGRSSWWSQHEWDHQRSLVCKYCSRRV